MSRYAHAYKTLLAHLRALAFISAAIINVSANPAIAESSLDVLAGTWRGNGTMLFEDGTSENITCTGYYRADPNMSVVFRCKGPTSNFELRSKLLKSEGDKVSGVWEERTYNVTGEASGTAAPGKLNVKFSGSLAGSLVMSFSSSSQSVSVSIDTKGTGIKGARLSFSRM
ncbi:MAG: hypothetical protein ACKVP4_00045 [Hyphomicrobium sp.]